MPGFNIHPLLVHFPIALLVVYSVLEWMPFKKITHLVNWFYVKAAFLFLGVMSTIPTGFAGKIIENEFRGKSALVGLHSHFAIYASSVYSILVILYLLAWLKRSKTQIRFTLPRVVVILFSILGFFLIVITGALGGIIVYGPNLDPFTAFVYNLFFR